MLRYVSEKLQISCQVVFTWHVSCQTRQYYYFFLCSQVQTNSSATSRMTNRSDKTFRMWSLRSQGNLVLKENGGNTPTAECTGVDEQQSSK